MIMKSDTLKKEANVNFYKVSIKFYKLCVTVILKVAKKKVFIARFFIFIIFIYLAFYFYKQIDTRFYIFMSEKNKKTYEIIKTIELRNDIFFETKYSEHKEINEESNFEIINSLKEENFSEKQEFYKETDKNSNEEIEKSYYIQLGTYLKKENAEKVKESANKFNPQIIKEEIKGNIYHKVIINEVPTREKAIEINKEIKEIFHDDIKPMIRVRY